LRPLQLVLNEWHLNAGRSGSHQDLEEYMMRRSYCFTSIAAIAVLLCAAASISAQVGQLRGRVLLKQADGTTIKAAGAQVDVFRTDLPGSFPSKADKNGEFVYAGLPYVGTYIIAASMPNASPSFEPNVKAGRETVYEIVLSPGDGRRLTADEAKKLAAGGGSGPSSGGGSESKEDKAKREAELKRLEEIKKENEKNSNINKVVGEAFTAGNAARSAKNWDEAIKQYDIGLAADPDQSALLTNKADVLKARGVERYNAGIALKDDAARTAAFEVAKGDFKAAADTATKATELVKKESAATDPTEQKRQAANKYIAFSTRAEAFRLFVTKADQTQTDAGTAAFEDLIAIETDSAKKAAEQQSLAQMLLDAGAGDKAFAEFQKILAQTPDDPDANLGAGLALFSSGDKAKYQDAANYLQHFVDKAPDTHKFKNDAKAVLAELKSTENVVPEKTPPRRGNKRP
jgi:tetratricopeptide (TPR) repeat protein